MLRQEPDEIARRAKLQFRSGFDDLDVLRWAEIVGKRGRYALVRHQHSPTPGTEVLISSSSSSPRLDLLDLLETLAITEAELVWAHPDVAVAKAPKKKSASLKRFAQARAPVLRKSAARRTGSPMTRIRAAAKKR